MSAPDLSPTPRPCPECGTNIRALHNARNRAMVLAHLLREIVEGHSPPSPLNLDALRGMAQELCRDLRGEP